MYVVQKNTSDKDKEFFTSHGQISIRTALDDILAFSSDRPNYRSEVCVKCCLQPAFIFAINYLQTWSWYNNSSYIIVTRQLTTTHNIYLFDHVNFAAKKQAHANDSSHSRIHSFREIASAIISKSTNIIALHCITKCLYGLLINRTTMD